MISATATKPKADAKSDGNGDTPERDTAMGDLGKGGSKVCADGKRRGFGKPGRSGPAKGNTNAIRHGLVAGKLPKDCQHIEIKINGLRRTLEAAVMAVKSEISLIDAAIIQTCCKWERHGALALRWLTKAGADLKPVERLTFSREIAKASTERDKSLAQLGLDRNERDDEIEAMYRRLPDATTDNGKGDGDEAA